MITLIQTVLQKHHKVVFSILLVAIIIAFVFTIGSVPFLGDRYQGGSSRDDSLFHGYDLNNQAVVSQFQTCAFFEAITQGTPIRSREQLEVMMLSQMYLMSVARDLGIRQISESELKNYIETRPLFLSVDGKFDVAAWDKFKKERVATGSMSEEALTAVFAQNALVEKMGKLLGGPGYVLTSEIENDYKRFYGTWDFELAVLPASSVKVTAPDSAALEKYFKANQEAYRIGEGCVIEATFFPIEEFSKKVTAPTDADLSAYYGANMQKYATFKDGKRVTPAFADVKEKVKADFIIDTALRLAATKAEEISAAIYDANIVANSKEFKDFIAKEKLVLKTLPAIRTTDVKTPEGFPAELVQTALALDTKLFYTDPVVSDKGVWLGFLKEKLVSYLPKLDEVKAKVVEDFEASEKAKLFAQKGETLSLALQKAVKEGRSFEAVAKTSGASVEKVNAFSLRNPSQNVIGYYQILRTELLKLKVGGVSKMQTSGDNGYIVYLKKHSAPAVDKNSKEFADLTKNVESSFSRLLSTSVISPEITVKKDQ